MYILVYSKGVLFLLYIYNYLIVERWFQEKEIKEKKRWFEYIKTYIIIIHYYNYCNCF